MELVLRRCVHVAKIHIRFAFVHSANGPSVVLLFHTVGPHPYTLSRRLVLHLCPLLLTSSGNSSGSSLCMHWKPLFVSVSSRVTYANLRSAVLFRAVSKEIGLSTFLVLCFRTHKTLMQAVQLEMQQYLGVQLTNICMSGMSLLQPMETMVSYVISERQRSGRKGNSAGGPVLQQIEVRVTGGGLRAWL